MGIGGRVGLCIDHQGVGIRPIRDPHFAAIQDVVVTGLFCSKLHADYVRSGVVFTHRQRADFGTADEIRKELRFLGLSAVTEDLVYAQVGVRAVREAD